MLPGALAAAEAVCVIAKSAPLTVTDVVVVLFAGTGSVPVSLTVAVFVIVEPTVTPAFTSTTMEKLPVVEFAATDPVAVQVIVPVPPTAGTVPHVHPVGAAAETNVVFVGVLCVSVAPMPASALLFVTVSVYVMSPPVATGLGDSVCVIERSGVCTVTLVAGAFAVTGLFPCALAASVSTVPLAGAGLLLTVAVILNVVLSPAAYVPPLVSVQVTTCPAAAHVQLSLPALFAAVPKFVWAGRFSVTVSGCVTATVPVFVSTSV